MKQIKEISKERYVIFIIAIILSGLGNSLPAYSNAGASPWTAACINIGVTTGLKVGTILNIFFLCFYIFNKIYTKEKITLKKDGTLLVFTLLFGNFVNLLLEFLYFLSPPPTNLFFGAMVSLLGSACCAAAVSLFIKVDVLLLPIDDFINNLTKICKGNVILSGLISFGLGIGFAVVFGLYNGEISSVNYITILNFLFFGSVIDLFNKNLKFVNEYLKMV